MVIGRKGHSVFVEKERASRGWNTLQEQAGEKRGEERWIKEHFFALGKEPES